MKKFVRSIVALFVVSVSSAAFAAEPTPAEVLAEQTKHNQEVLAKANADLAAAKAAYEPYKAGVDAAEVAVKTAQENVLRIGRHLQPFADLATANAAVASAATALAADPTNPALREAMTKAQTDVAAAEAALDNSIQAGKAGDAEFKKLTERAVAPEDALKQLQEKAQRALIVARAELARLKANAKTAKDALDAAEKAADATAQKLAPLVTISALTEIKSEIAGLRLEVKEGFKALTAKGGTTKKAAETILSVGYDKASAELIARALALLEKQAREGGNPALLEDRIKKLETAAATKAAAATRAGGQLYRINGCGQFCPAN